MNSHICTVTYIALCTGVGNCWVPDLTSTLNSSNWTTHNGSIRFIKSFILLLTASAISSQLSSSLWASFTCSSSVSCCINKCMSIFLCDVLAVHCAVYSLVSSSSMPQDWLCCSFSLASKHSRCREVDSSYRLVGEQISSDSAEIGG